VASSQKVLFVDLLFKKKKKAGVRGEEDKTFRQQTNLRSQQRFSE
jgi:hypothetical protein